MVKVSIIVPIYNTEKYIEKCLKSLVEQTLKEIEIICVNDASEDNSITLVREIANRDPRIKIIEQKHLLQGAARNNGVSIATGEYIGFVDSDDWVDLNYYEKLYNAAKKYDSDIAIATNVRIGNGKTKKRLHIAEEKFVTSMQDKCEISKQAKNPCPTNKIYRRQMLIENSITWPEGVYCEDKLYTIKAIYFANGIVTVPEVHYYYFRNPNSTVNMKKKEYLKKLLSHKNEARKSVVEFLREHNINFADKQYWYIKKDHKFLKIKESLKTRKYILFGVLPIWEKKIKLY